MINGNSITLSSTYVSAPVAVRYGYGTFFRVNLFNKAGLPAVPFRTDTFAPDTYYRLFADSEIRRFPEAWQLDHGKRLYFGYAQGVGCCAMLQVWKKTGDRRYFDYVEAWADSLVDDKGEIHLYKKETYNLDYINSGKVLFDLYKETKKEKYKLAIENLIDQLKSNLVQQMEVSGIRKYTLIRCGWMDCIWLLLLWLDMELNLIVRNGLMRLLNSSLSAISIHTIPRRDFIIMHGMRTGAALG